MEVIGEPWKCLPWQITTIIDKFGVKKIEIKYFARKGNGFDFNNYQVLYVLPGRWKQLLNEIRKKKK